MMHATRGGGKEPSSPSKRAASGGPSSAESASKKQAQEDEVKAMFAELLQGQRAMESKIGSELGNIRKEIGEKDARTQERISSLATGLQARLDKLEVKVQVI